MFTKRNAAQTRANGMAETPPSPAADSRKSRLPSQPRHSAISPDMEITGDLDSTGDITLEGRVEGNIRCRTLTLNGAPVIKGDVNAETVRLCGTFGGKIEAGKVHLTKTARMTGDIVYRTLTIETGATFEGTLSRRPGAS